MAHDIKLTSDTPFAITVSGTVSGGTVIADVRPAALVAAGGVLLAANDLSDIADPDAALGNLGASAVGTSLVKAASGDAAMAAVGMSANGQNIVKAAGGIGARIFLGLSSFQVSCVLPDIVSANAAVVEFFLGAPGGVVQAWAASTVAVAGADLTFTVDYGGNPLPIIGGNPWKIAVGAKTGHIAFDTGAAVENPNVPLVITVGGGNTAAGLVNMTFQYSPPDIG